MRRCLQATFGALLALALSSARPARAEPPLPAGKSAPAAPSIAPPIDALIEVERGAGSEMCPDAAAVFRSIERLFPERAFRPSAEREKSAASARVAIRSLANGHEAVLTMWLPYRGERVILEKDDDCRGLADALALAFVLMVEPPDSKRGPASEPDAPTPSTKATEPTAKPKEPPPRGPTPATAPAAAPSSDQVAPRRARSFSGSLTASAVGGFGLLSKPSGGAAAGVELFHELGWGLALEGLRLWSPPARAEGGSVTLSLWAVAFGPCYRLRVSNEVSLDGCVRVGAGAQYARVEGFLTPKSAFFPWTVLVPTLGARVEASKVLSGFLRIGPVGQLQPQSFSATLGNGSGRVPVAAAPNFGVMAELGLALGPASLW